MLVILVRSFFPGKQSEVEECYINHSESFNPPHATQVFFHGLFAYLIIDLIALCYVQLWDSRDSPMIPIIKSASVGRRNASRRPISPLFVAVIFVSLEEM